LNKLLPLLAFSALLLVPVGALNAFAGSPTPSCGDMYGSTSRGTATIPGSIVIISQTDGSQTFLGDPTTGNVGMAGLAFDTSGRLFGSTVQGSLQSNLVEIDPTDGSLISSNPMTVQGQAIKVQDLTVQPSTNILFGYVEDDLAFAENLISIDKSTGVGTIRGQPGPADGSIGFAPDGTLYFLVRGGDTLHTLDPSDGSILTSVGTDGVTEADALGVRSDGTIFVAGTAGNDSEIFTLSPGGTVVSIGDPDDEGIADLDFLPCIAVGGELLSIDSTALILAGAQSFSWMIPVLLSGIGIGLFVVSRKSE